MIRLLDLFHLPTRVLRAFVAGRCALCQMRATIGRKRIREEKSSLRVSPRRSLWRSTGLPGRARAGRGEACFICVKHCVNRQILGLFRLRA